MYTSHIRGLSQQEVDVPVFSDSLCEGLEKLGWDVCEEEYARQVLVFGKRLVHAVLSDAESDDAEDEVIKLSCLYYSRYSESVQSQQLFSEFEKLEGQLVFYEHPNSIYLSAEMIVDTFSTKEILEALEDFVSMQVFQFLELISVYEIHARLSGRKTRVRDRAHTPSTHDQIMLITTTHMSS